MGQLFINRLEDIKPILLATGIFILRIKLYARVQQSRNGNWKGVPWNGTEMEWAKS